MNITLSADENLVRKARRYAQRNQTTLNQMIRDYLRRIVSEPDPEEAATAFRRVAMEQPGRSPQGWRFDRDALHRYDGDTA